MRNPARNKTVVPTSPIKLFARNFFRYPLMLGSIIPSSRFLVKDLLSEIDWNTAQVLVEFGPGVGTITREVLKRMRPDATLVAIELNEEFVNYLSATIPDKRLRVVHGSAARVRQILAQQGLAPADCIISGLPYTWLPEDVRKEIISESRHALKEEGTLVAFHFTPMLRPYLRDSFGSVKSGFQFLNILPATIFHCTP
ncbi:MAG TPA: rRNA adenine N-6-methyltransferase family protein [Candidatus Sulfotelmatobacter sp.]|nr:rRNA adenine N-6-methyltransferase family protein [Candidatus Sulfotelmatobacter sp.]